MGHSVIQSSLLCHNTRLIFLFLYRVSIRIGVIYVTDNIFCLLGSLLFCHDLNKNTFRFSNPGLKAILCIQAPAWGCSILCGWL